MSDLLIRPRYIALDTSHLGQWAKDATSRNAAARKSAQDFESWLLASGFVPLICLHHIQELAGHGDPHVVLRRFRFLGARGLLAWISVQDGSGGIGSFLTALAEEAKAASEMPDSRAIAVRACVRKRLIHAGSGAELLGPDPDIWMEGRPEFLKRRRNDQELVALVRLNTVDMRDRTIGELMDGGLRSGPELDQRLNLIRGTYEVSIRRKGDNGIASPEALAASFVGEVGDMGRVVLASGAPFVETCLGIFGISPDDIRRDMTLGEVLDRGLFRRQLTIAVEGAGYSVPEILATVQEDQLPSQIISKALRQHAPDLPERKGSEENDTMLAALSAYADLTLVDKRTLENVRRAQYADPSLKDLMGRVERVVSYAEIPALL